jgi:hypothetical protein
MVLLGMPTPPERDRILQALEEMPDSFVLCGSRAFGYARPDSDYDFFTETNSQLQNHLLALGFVRHEGQQNSIYTDNGCVAVYRHSCGIDIQARKDCDTYNRACLFIQTHKEYKKLVMKSNPYRSLVWNMLLFMAERWHIHAG